MQTVHGSHHRGRVTEQDYKQHLKKRQSQIYLVDLPEDDYVVTKDGQFRCIVCPHLPPFTSGKLLADHIKGKKHIARKQHRVEGKKTIKEGMPDPSPQAPSNIKPSMALPSLLQRTQAITERVLAGNHRTSPKVAPPRPTVFPNSGMFVPPSLSPSGEPLWRQQSTFYNVRVVHILVLDKKKEEELYAKGFRKNEKGEWYRDETVEFDSDDEPDLASLLSSAVQ